MSTFITIVATLLGAAIGTLFVMPSTRQCRKPSDRAGRAVLHRMNRSHAELTKWGLSHIDVGTDFTILDVGCGGGQTINTLAATAINGKVFGIDYSDESVAVARETNRVAIERGQADIQGGTVSHLPFADKTFDLVTAVETHYYWPDLPADVREVLRVLKPGGAFLIIAEAYRGRKNDWLYRPVMRLLFRAAYLSVDEHRRLLVDAGYHDVDVFEERSRSWICAVGRRALSIALQPTT
jgi:SAM-dependent methyltransferase